MGFPRNCSLKCPVIMVLNVIYINSLCGVGNGNQLQYSYLENPMTEEPGRLQSRGLQSWTRLSTHMHALIFYVFIMYICVYKWGKNKELVRLKGICGVV